MGQVSPKLLAEPITGKGCCYMCSSVYFPWCSMHMEKCRHFSIPCCADVSAEVALSTQHHLFLVDATEEPPVTLNLAVFPHLPCIPISTSVTTSVWPVFSSCEETWAVTWGYVGSLVLPWPCKCRRLSLFPESMVYIWFSFHYFRCQLEGLCLFPSVTASK